MSNYMQPKYIKADEIEKILTWPMVNQAVEEALKAIDRNIITKTNETVKHKEDLKRKIIPYKHEPSRILLQCEKPDKVLLTMPSFIDNYQLNHLNNKDSNSKSNTNEGHSMNKTLACKVVTSFSENKKHQPPLPNIQAHILLFDQLNGQLKCIMDGTQITAWRTAAASIVATKYLYLQSISNKSNAMETVSINIAIIGCGTQGRSHAFGLCSTYNVKAIYLWNRTKSKTIQLANDLQKSFPQINVIVTDYAKDAVRNANVICVGTYSPNALIDYSMLKDSDRVHINTVGAGQIHYGEVSQDIYDQAVVYVDSMKSAKIELHGLKARIVGEVGEIIRSEIIQEAKPITIFQSMGMASEDATVAQAVYNIISSVNVIKKKS